jgi:hypothetical protein
MKEHIINKPPSPTDKIEFKRGDLVRPRTYDNMKWAIKYMPVDMFIEKGHADHFYKTVAKVKDIKPNLASIKDDKKKIFNHYKKVDIDTPWYLLVFSRLDNKEMWYPTREVEEFTKAFTNMDEHIISTPGFQFKVGDKVLFTDPKYASSPDKYHGIITKIYSNYNEVKSSIPADEADVQGFEKKIKKMNRKLYPSTPIFNQPWYVVQTTANRNILSPQARLKLANMDEHIISTPGYNFKIGDHVTDGYETFYIKDIRKGRSSKKTAGMIVAVVDAPPGLGATEWEIPFSNLKLVDDNMEDPEMHFETFSKQWWTNNLKLNEWNLTESPPIEFERDQYEEYVLQNRSKIEKAAAIFNIPIPDMEYAFNAGKEIALSDDIWSKLQNSKSYKIKSLDDAIQAALKAGIDPKPYIEFIKNGKELPLPLILCYGQDQYYLVGGDIVLSLYKGLGSIPTALQGTLNLKINEDEEQQQNEPNEPPIKEKHADIVKYFIKFAAKELKLKNLPTKVTLSYNTDQAKNDHSFGHFDPKDNTIWLYVKDRNTADFLRTLAHELVHRKQAEEGRLKPGDGATGSDIENEANAEAGILLRKFGQENEEIYEVINEHVISLPIRKIQITPSTSGGLSSYDIIDKRFPPDTYKADIGGYVDIYKKDPNDFWKPADDSYEETKALLTKLKIPFEDWNARLGGVPLTYGAISLKNKEQIEIVDNIDELKYK